MSTILSVLDYGDIVYACCPVLKPLDTVYHSAIRFITGDHFKTQHCALYKNVGWPSSSVRRDRHCLLFIYRALLGKLPFYLTSLFKFNSFYHSTRSQSHISLDTPVPDCHVSETSVKL